MTISFPRTRSFFHGGERKKNKTTPEPEAVTKDSLDPRMCVIFMRVLTCTSARAKRYWAKVERNAKR